MLFLYTNIHYKNSDGTETEETVKTLWPEECQRDMPNSARLTNICTMKTLTEKLYEKEGATCEFRSLRVVNNGEQLIADFNLPHSNKEVLITVSSAIKDF